MEDALKPRRKHTEETIAKMRSTRNDPEFKTMMSQKLKGLKKTKEHRAKLSVALSGKPKSEEHKAKIKASSIRYFNSRKRTSHDG